MIPKQGWRNRVGGEGRGPLILADQLTLSQPKGSGADYALNNITCPQNFQTFRSPCQVVRMLFTRVVINNETNLVSLVQIESEEK